MINAFENPLILNFPWLYPQYPFHSFTHVASQMYFTHAFKSAGTPEGNIHYIFKSYPQ
jgi:hypothetical protein